MNQIEIWNKISETYKKREAYWNMQGAVISTKCGKLSWKKFDNKFRIAYRNTPILECKVGIRVELFPSLPALEKVIEKKTMKMLAIAEKALFDYNENRGNK